MTYFYILFPFAVWLISQTIKFLVRLAQKSVPSHLKGAFWVYVWGGGAPSTHTAILTSSLFLVWCHYGPSPLSTFCLVVTMLWLYDMVANHKRQELMNDYVNKSDSAPLKKIATEGYLMDLAGHSSKEIILGAILGLTLGFLASIILRSSL